MLWIRLRWGVLGIVLFLVVELLSGSLGWSSSSIVCSLALVAGDTVDSRVEDSFVLFILPSGGCGGFNFLSLLNHCNECCVVLVVMLTGYLPDMQSKHLIKLIMMIGIVNFSSEFLVKLLN